MPQENSSTISIGSVELRAGTSKMGRSGDTEEGGSTISGCSLMGSNNEVVSGVLKGRTGLGKGVVVSMVVKETSVEISAGSVVTKGSSGTSKGASWSNDGMLSCKIEHGELKK